MPEETEDVSGKPSLKNAWSDRPEEVRTSGNHTNRIKELDDVIELKKREEEREKELVEQHIENTSNNFSARRLLKAEYISDQGYRKLVHSYISWWPFDFAIGIIIILNAVTIGIETQYSAQNKSNPVWLETVGGIFLFVYTAEFCLRVFAYTLMGALVSNWVKFDAFLVVCGLTDVIIKMIGSSNEVLEKIMLTRMLRLARLARAARLMIQFKVLWQPVRGLMGSLLTVLWTFVLIGALLYIFAIIGVELIKPDPAAGPEYEEAAKMFQGGLGSVMLTLVQFVTMDSIGAIYRPMSLAKPYLMIYFGSFLLLVSIALMNLVTAIIVDSAVQQSQGDKEAQKAYDAQKRKALLPKLKQMFEELDADGSGELDLDEIKQAPPELIESLEEITNLDDVESLYKMLDYDDSGGISIDEFVEGMVKAANNQPIEILCMMRQCSEILRASRAMEDRLGTIEDRLEKIEANEEDES